MCCWGPGGAAGWQLRLLAAGLDWMVCGIDWVVVAPQCWWCGAGCSAWQKSGTAVVPAHGARALAAPGAGWLTSALLPALASFLQRRSHGLAGALPADRLERRRHAGGGGAAAQQAAQQAAQHAACSTAAAQRAARQPLGWTCGCNTEAHCLLPAFFRPPGHRLCRPGPGGGGAAHAGAGACGGPAPAPAAAAVEGSRAAGAGNRAALLAPLRSPTSHRASSCPLPLPHTVPGRGAAERAAPVHQRRGLHRVRPA